MTPKPHAAIGGPVSEAFDFDGLLQKARNHLQELTAFHVQTWNKGESRWSVDQETGLLTWKFQDGRVVTAPFQIVGTYNTRDGTFLWAWANSSIDEAYQEDAMALKAFGEEHGIDLLQQEEIECGEDVAWNLTGLAALLCKGNGAYLGPSGPVHVFMTHGAITMRRGS